MLVVQESLAALSSQVVQFMNMRHIHPAPPRVPRADPSRSWVDPASRLDNEDQPELTSHSPFKVTSRSSVRLRNSSVVHKSASTPALDTALRKSMLGLNGQQKYNILIHFFYLREN
jgi:hypothetical protein